MQQGSCLCVPTVLLPHAGALSVLQVSQAEKDAFNASVPVYRQ